MYVYIYKYHVCVYIYIWHFLVCCLIQNPPFFTHSQIHCPHKLGMIHICNSIVGCRHSSQYIGKCSPARVAQWPIHNCSQNDYKFASLIERWDFEQMALWHLETRPRAHFQKSWNNCRFQYVLKKWFSNCFRKYTPLGLGSWALAVASWVFSKTAWKLIFFQHILNKTPFSKIFENWSPRPVFKHVAKPLLKI